MKITILTLFPEMFSGFLSESIIGRAVKDGKIKIDIVDLRHWGIGKHKSVDDTPYGGGAGMVMRVDVIARAIQDTKSKLTTSSQRPVTILLTPQGEVFKQQKAQTLADDMIHNTCNLLLVCGHYEGFDERIRDYVDEEISVGDYVLTGGELAAAVITDAVVRLLPGVLGKEASHQDESFSSPLTSHLSPRTYLEYPHYTRPEDFEGKKVPEVLLSGHHANIEAWRLTEAERRTKKRRPDLLG